MLFPIPSYMALGVLAFMHYLIYICFVKGVSIDSSPLVLYSSSSASSSSSSSSPWYRISWRPLLFCTALAAGENDRFGSIYDLKYAYIILGLEAGTYVWTLRGVF